MLFGQSEGQVSPMLGNTVSRNNARIRRNPASFRFIRGTLRTSLRSICLLGDRRARFRARSNRSSLSVSRNARQHVLDFLDNHARNERFRYRRRSGRIPSFGWSGRWRLYPAIYRMIISSEKFPITCSRYRWTLRGPVFTAELEQRW